MHEDVIRLIENWREQSQGSRKLADSRGDHISALVLLHDATVLDCCANELEAALAADPVSPLSPPTFRDQLASELKKIKSEAWAAAMDLDTVGSHGCHLTRGRAAELASLLRALYWYGAEVYQDAAAAPSVPVERTPPLRGRQRLIERSREAINGEKEGNSGPDQGDSQRDLGMLQGAVAPLMRGCTCGFSLPCPTHGHDDISPSVPEGGERPAPSVLVERTTDGD